MRIDTSCENCVFAEIEDNKQTGCKLGALETFGKLGKVDDLECGYKRIVGRVCMYRRYPEWLSDNPEKQVKEEVLPPINFLIRHKNGSLEQTLQSIKDLEYEKIKIIIAYTGKTVETQKTAQRFFGLDKLYFSKILTEYNDFDMLLDEGFKLVSNGYTCILDSGDLVESSFVFKLNNLINVRLRRLALIKDHPRVVNNTVFKALGREVQKSFEQKLIENGGQDMIFSWSEL